MNNHVPDDKLRYDLNDLAKIAAKFSKEENVSIKMSIKDDRIKKITCFETENLNKNEEINPAISNVKIVTVPSLLQDQYKPEYNFSNNDIYNNKVSFNSALFLQ